MADADLTLRLAVIAMMARAALALMLAGAAGLLAVGGWVAWDAVAYRRRLDRKEEVSGGASHS
nr:MAG: hypothetical protein DIU70_14890 [Bacillota bacterium]